MRASWRRCAAELLAGQAHYLHCTARLQHEQLSCQLRIAAAPLLSWRPALQFGVVHISAGDLLRAEVASGSPEGKRAQKYMDSGNLVPNQVVVDMVKARLSKPDAQEKGWLLDGYPRSADQAKAIIDAGIHPDIFINIEVGLWLACQGCVQPSRCGAPLHVQPQDT